MGIHIQIQGYRDETIILGDVEVQSDLPVSYSTWMGICATLGLDEVDEDDDPCSFTSAPTKVLKKIQAYNSTIEVHTSSTNNHEHWIRILYYMTLKAIDLDRNIVGG
jgi:hypothetical protein